MVQRSRPQHACLRERHPGGNPESPRVNRAREVGLARVRLPRATQLVSHHTWTVKVFWVGLKHNIMIETRCDDVASGNNNNNVISGTIEVVKATAYVGFTAERHKNKQAATKRCMDSVVFLSHS